MPSLSNPDDDVLMQYALGFLGEDETRRLQDLLANDARLASRLDALRTEVHRLGFAAPVVEPAAGLKNRILAGLPDPQDRGGVPEPTESEPAETVIRAHDTPWKTTPVPGITARLLHVDRKRRVATMLVRMEAGVVYPSHVHEETEEIYVLEGDMEAEGQAPLGPGDFVVSAKGSRHPEQRTIGGCLLLVHRSLRDRMG